MWKLSFSQGPFHLFRNKRGLLLNSVELTPLFATDLGFCFMKGTVLKFDKDRIYKGSKCLKIVDIKINLKKKNLLLGFVRNI